MINLPKKRSGSGAYSTYYALSRSVGIKILKTKRKFVNKKQAFNSRAYKKATEEAEILAQVYESGVVPKCYGVTIVKDKSEFKVGILMQHLGNKMLSMCKKKEGSKAYDKIYEALEDIGIDHRDLHDRNIMKYRNKFYAIDFTPNFIKVKEDV